jgi:hypothetical protein
MDASKLGAALSGNIVDRRGLDTMTPLALQMLRSRSGFPDMVNHEGSTGTATQNQPMHEPGRTPIDTSRDMNYVMFEDRLANMTGTTPRQSDKTPVIPPSVSPWHNLIQQMFPPYKSFGLNLRFKE